MRHEGQEEAKREEPYQDEAKQKEQFEQLM